MATRTVSLAGGNWNSILTWTGGVIPLTTDDAALNGTSGILIVNVNSTCRNITNDQGEILIADGITLTATGTTSITGAGAILNVADAVATFLFGSNPVIADGGSQIGCNGDGNGSLTPGPIPPSAGDIKLGVVVSGVTGTYTGGGGGTTTVF